MSRPTNHSRQVPRGRFHRTGGGPTRILNFFPSKFRVSSFPGAPRWRERRKTSVWRDPPTDRAESGIPRRLPAQFKPSNGRDVERINSNRVIHDADAKIAFRSPSPPREEERSVEKRSRSRSRPIDVRRGMGSSVVTPAPCTERKESKTGENFPRKRQLQRQSIFRNGLISLSQCMLRQLEKCLHFDTAKAFSS